MKMLAALFSLLTLSNALDIIVERSGRQCDNNLEPESRPHSISIKEFGAVGDGKTLNTIAFENAIFYVKSFADKGGAQLYVPPGKWLTGGFDLTSHLTLFLESGAVILGSKNPSHWGTADPLPSYGRGIEVPGKRYRSLINAYGLQDVVITGHNGTIDGQGFVWWDLFKSHSLNHSRPNLVEFIESKYIVVSNITIANAPAYNIHPVYCSNLHIHNVSIQSPPEAPSTAGIVPDSSDNVCIEDCSIRMGHDAISLKSGWDEYGISYGRPTTNVHIKRVYLQSSFGSCLAFGSEMSGGISEVHVENVFLFNSKGGILFSTTKGRGGYMEGIYISDVKMENVYMAFEAIGDNGTHPDDKYNPSALPVVDHITIQNVNGKNITVAGNFVGIQESPFTSFCLSEISLSVSSRSPWFCSNVLGYSESVTPKPCPALESSYSSSSSVCLSSLDSYESAAAM